MSLSTNVYGRLLCVLIAVVALASVSVAQDPGSTGVSVTTWQNDTHRTGRNLNEGTILYAFDAADTTGTGKLQQLYASSGSGSTCAADAMTVAATKFSIPTVANGYVYVGVQGPASVNSGNSGIFYIFGPNRTCP
jgi:hypothetical protein